MISHIARLCAMVAFTIALSNLAGYIFPLRALDWWTGLWVGASAPRMAWQTALAILLLSSCIILLSLDKSYKAIEKELCDR